MASSLASPRARSSFSLAMTVSRLRSVDAAKVCYRQRGEHSVASAAEDKWGCRRAADHLEHVLPFAGVIWLGPLEVALDVDPLQQRLNERGDGSALYSQIARARQHPCFKGGGTKRTHSLCLSAKLVVDVDKLATRLEGQAVFGKRDLAASQDRYRTLLGRLDDLGDAFESLSG
jgi:hypothetical protein